MKRSEVREAERQKQETAFALELEVAKADLATYPSKLSIVRREREAEGLKHSARVRQQDKLLFVGFYILLNLAENLTVERKMVRNLLLPKLVMTLNRRFEDLLILCVTFVKKLCIIGENKDAIKLMNCVGGTIPNSATTGNSSSSPTTGTTTTTAASSIQTVLDNLIRFIPCSSQPLITITLRLLFNLSFDKVCIDFCIL